MGTETPELLVHSMAAFEEIILGALAIARAKRIIEVGAESGGMTRALIEYTRVASGALVSIDPAPAPQAEALFEDCNHATLVKQRSLDALPQHSGDAWLIDGDHNYYTVLNESRQIWELVCATATPPLIFYHDVGWPWGRRDLYYDPGAIPSGFLHPHAWDRGVTLDHAELIQGGFRGDGRWACALEEGGERNGVLTAVEDFVLGKEERLAWAFIPAVFGLGVLFDKQAPWAEELTAWLLPYHMNPLLARLERNRLECYLRVIALQDVPHAAAA